MRDRKLSTRKDAERSGKETAQRGSSSNGTLGNTLEDLHRVSHELIQKLIRSAFFPDKEAIASYLPGDVPARESRELVRG
jgi:hypothetical protein